MTTDEIIQHSRNAPVGESVDLIAQSLSKQSVFVGTEEVTPTKDGKIVGKLRLKTGMDKYGHPWAYVYTSETNFSKAFPHGGPFAEMSFASLFKIVDQDPRFGGIYLNSGSEISYPIPRELFGHFRRSVGSD